MKQITHTQSPTKCEKDSIYLSIERRAMLNTPIGSALPPLYVHDISGMPLELVFTSQEKWRLIVTGSYTCGQTRKKLSALNAFSKQWSHMLDIYFIYVIEAHPTNVNSPYHNGIWQTNKNVSQKIFCTQPVSIEERIQLALKLKITLGPTIAIYIDNMNNDCWSTLGQAPNTALLIDDQRIVKYKQGWLNINILHNYLHIIERARIASQANSSNKPHNI